MGTLWFSNSVEEKAGNERAKKNPYRPHSEILAEVGVALASSG